MVMQVPAERAIPASISFHSAQLMLRLPFSAQYFQTSEPEPENLAAKVAAHHRPRRQEDHRQVHRDGTHDGCGSGLVTAAHQHRAINGMLAQQLLRLHCE